MDNKIYAKPVEKVSEKVHEGKIFKGFGSNPK
jgi:hypothetical protein